VCHSRLVRSERVCEPRGMEDGGAFAFAPLPRWPVPAEVRGVMCEIGACMW
jgi:hypothetical protein